MRKAVKTKKKPDIKQRCNKGKKAVKPVKKPSVRKTAKSTVKKAVKSPEKKVTKPIIKKIEKQKTVVKPAPVQPQNQGLPDGADKQPAGHRRPLIVFPK